MPRMKAPKNHKKIFTRTAMKVKKINLNSHASRGGICL